MVDPSTAPTDISACLERIEEAARSDGAFAGRAVDVEPRKGGDALEQSRRRGLARRRRPGPWGGRPGGGQQPPDLEELLRRSQEKVKSLFPGGGGGGRRAARAWSWSASRSSGCGWPAASTPSSPTSRGSSCASASSTASTAPGLNYHLPAPIESVEKVPVTRVNRIEVGFRSAADRPACAAAGWRATSTDEALMLTGDENIVDINFVVLWRIGDAADYRFNIRDPENTVKAAAESVMREIIGQTPIVEATTEGRRAIEQRAREQLQQLMNDYGAGILIDEVQLQKADPPAEVIDAFRDVQRAQADRERAQNEAEAFANDIIPRARGEAERLLQEAQAYRQEVTARATGESRALQVDPRRVPQGRGRHRAPALSRDDGSRS